MRDPSTIVFLGGTVLLPDGELPAGAVTCRDGRIASVGDEAAADLRTAGAVVNAGGGYICPGFVDQHVHGGGGADFMDAELEGTRTAIAVHTRHGTTSIMPTTTTGSPQQITSMLVACAQYAAEWSPHHGARLAGVHLYGPYFAADKVGAHPPAGRRDPDPREYHTALESGIIRVATCAAELPGACDFYRAARDRGCLVTCGHSNASWGEMQRAYDNGMRHVDHFWCAMSSVPSIRQRLGVPMQGSMEQFVLFHDEMSTEVIADGEHLSPELLRFAYKMKGPRRLCLVTDSSRAVDMPPGDYIIGPRSCGTKFYSDGRAGRTADGKGLSSGVVGMDHMIRQMVAATGAPLHEVIRMASLTPAERCGISRDVGSLEPGKLADIVLLTPDLQVQSVYLDGQAFSRAG